MNREQLLRLNAAVDTSVTVNVPGEILLDLDGTPTAVEPSRTMPATMLGAIVARSEVEAAGLTPADLPNLRIIEPEGTEHD